ncbi:MAG: saccharopine dehydrogenase NADP-binding domain-containing protein [Theionarchaea archaeon]|nr:saccharopine dehydrogenase NADP-binding domain-containing protein [Theionarchaea archaeon]
MKILVLGSGMMGSALAYDLKTSGYEPLIVDLEKKRAKSVAKSIDAPYAIADVSDQKAIKPLMEECVVAISAAPYFYNEQLAGTAIDTGCHFCDLGGNNEVVTRELSMNDRAREKDVLIIPNCGLAPGMANVIAAQGIEEMDATHIQIRVGGLPQNPQPPLDYTLVFSVHGLLNEYIEPAVVIRNGEIREVPSLTETEEIDFPPIGILEAFHTSGGTSTLPQTYYGRLQELDYKTIRYQGHCEKMKVLVDIGMCSEESLSIGTYQVKPRDVLSKVLERVLPHEEKDMVLMRITARGKKGKKVYEMIDYFDKESHITAMARTTAFPTSIIAQMIASGIITDRGACPPEKIVPPRLFIDELEKRNIIIKTHE